LCPGACSCKIIEKVTEQFLRNLAKGAKIAPGGALGGPGGPLG